MVSTTEMVDSVNVLILADKWVTTEGISEQQKISVGTAYKIVHDDLAFSKVGFHWVPKMLTPEYKASYYRKNSGNHQPVWLGTAATSYLQSRYGPF